MKGGCLYWQSLFFCNGNGTLTKKKYGDGPRRPYIKKWYGCHI